MELGEGGGVELVEDSERNNSLVVGAGGKSSATASRATGSWAKVSWAGGGRAGAGVGVHAVSAVPKEDQPPCPHSL